MREIITMRLKFMKESQQRVIHYCHSLYGADTLHSLETIGIHREHRLTWSERVNSLTTGNTPTPSRRHSEWFLPWSYQMISVLKVYHASLSYQQPSIQEDSMNIFTSPSEAAHLRQDPDPLIRVNLWFPNFISCTHFFNGNTQVCGIMLVLP